MGDLVAVKVNADGVGYSIPSPVAGQPDINAAGYRGEVIKVTPQERDRLRNVRVRVFYDDPVTGRVNGAVREEPSVVDANDDEKATAEIAEKARADIRELEDKLAEARAKLPLGVAASEGRSPLALAATEPRLLPPSDPAPRSRPKPSGGTPPQA